MKFTSTRDNSVSVSASEAIVNGISADGGLYVPETFPVVTAAELENLIDKTYEERAAFLLSKFLTDFTEAELLECAEQAYSRFDGDPAPVAKMDDTTFVMELWHGPTCAFKDIALTILPHLMTKSKEKQGIRDKIEILVATSGDTGKAALEGFKDVSGTGIIVFYPSKGVSDVQKLQMTTQEGDNVFVAGVKGNFDDCQSAVKRIFADAEIQRELKEKGVVLSSANSINWGRLVPQIVYYFSAYADLVESGEIASGDKINFCVPTGNFGNILAGYYALRMGLPVHKLICASNSNNILTDFFETGEYDTNREFLKTMSPSMDILISSNLERLLFEFCGRDAQEIARRMEKLKKTGKYSVAKAERIRYSQYFAAGFSAEEETEESIANFFDEYDYPLDPHTAVAVDVYNAYVTDTNDKCKTVIVSTASPYKFAQDVLYAITERREKDAFQAVKKLYSETAMEVPDSIEALKDKAPVYTEVFDKSELGGVVLERA